jgi:hypothetical protein
LGTFAAFSSTAGRRLWGGARRLEAVTAINVNVGHAHSAAFLWPGTSVPLPRARALTGIGLSGDAIGRRTGAGGVGGRSAGGLTGRSTVGSTGIAWRRGIGWSRAIGWRRAVGWRSRRAILCIRRFHANGRSHNAHASDSDQSAFHDFLPFRQHAGGSNAHVKANVPTISFPLNRSHPAPPPLRPSSPF